MDHFRQRLITCWMLLCLLYIIAFSAFAATYSGQLCQLPQFSCLRIKPRQSWQSLWPDQEQRDLIMRVNRMNTRLYPGLVIAVPHDVEGKNIMDFSPFPHHILPKGERILAFDPKAYAFAAYEADGTLLHWGPASGGANWCHDIGRACRTATGHFRIFSKGGADCISHKFPLPNGGAPMPYCMFFYHGQAFHGSNHVPGYHASHSCVRIFTEDAGWLNKNFISAPNAHNRYRGTKVIIGPY